MADYIKPLINDGKNDSEAFKEKFDQKKEEIENIEIEKIEKQNVIAGMGDFDYNNFHILYNGLSEFDQYDLISSKTRYLMTAIDNEVAQTVMEQQWLGNRLDDFERSLQLRKDLIEVCKKMNGEEIQAEIEKCSDTNKLIEKKIINIEQTLESWQCLIDQFRKIPDESDCD